MHLEARILRGPAWIAVIAIAVLSLVHGEYRPHITALHFIEHFAAYFLISAVLAIAYKGAVRSLLLFICLVIYAGLLEIAQVWVPGRAARVADFAASSLGVLVGIAFVSFVLWIWRQKTNSFE